MKPITLDDTVRHDRTRRSHRVHTINRVPQQNRAACEQLPPTDEAARQIALREDTPPNKKTSPIRKIGDVFLS